MIILSGPSGPKFIADAFVVSENVGDGGPGEAARLGEMASVRSERARGMIEAAAEGWRSGYGESQARSQVLRAGVMSQYPSMRASHTWKAALSASASRDPISFFLSAERGPGVDLEPVPHLPSAPSTSAHSAMADAPETTPSTTTEHVSIDDVEEDPESKVCLIVKQVPTRADHTCVVSFFLM